MLTVPRLKTVSYPSSDGKPMAETDFHAELIMQTVSLLRDRFSVRKDVYVSGNSFVYYQEGNPRKRLAPDCHIVFGVSNHFRNSFKVWEEGKLPDVVFEFTSRKTRKEDTVEKFEIYRDIWRVKEYFLFDPTSDYLKVPLVGYRLEGGAFRPIPLMDDRLESRVLGLTMERHLQSLLFREVNTGEQILRADARRAVEAARQAEEESRRAEEELAKRKSADQEIERLKAQIAELTKRD